MGSACPRYTTSYFATVGYYSYYVEFATSPETGPDGTLATAFSVDFKNASPTNAAETECKAEMSSTATNPGTYYWQVQNVDVDTGPGVPNPRIIRLATPTPSPASRPTDHPSIGRQADAITHAPLTNRRPYQL